MNKKIKLWIKIDKDKKYNYSVLCNDFRIAGMKWNDIDNGIFREIEVDLQDFRNALNGNFETPVKEKEMKQHLQQHDKDTLIELYLQKDFDTKQQLAEKDKEIEELKFEKRNLFGLIEKVSSKGQQEIRKQVCETIRSMALDYYYFQGDAEKFDGNLYLISKFDLEENILNKLEQGEQTK